MPSQPLRLSQGMGGGGGGGVVECTVIFTGMPGVGEVHFNIPLASCVIPLGNILLGWMGYMVVFHWVAVLFS